MFPGTATADNPWAHDQVLYLSLDEAGDFNFSPTGTKHFVLTCVTCQRPFRAHAALREIRYDFLEKGLDLEYFHASEDKQSVRDAVFEAIAACIGDYSVYSVIMRKNMTNPVLRDPARLYPRAFEWLVRYALRRCVQPPIQRLIIVTDRLPMKKKRRAVEKPIRTMVASHLPSDVSYALHHHESRSDLNLQIADYLNWAIYRKLEHHDGRSYNLIRDAIRGEGDLFAHGDQRYY